MKQKIHPLYWLVFLTAPLALWGKWLILPTFDDWNTLSSPNMDPEWAKYFLSFTSVWRPFDAAFGYLYSLCPEWYPRLSHLVIMAGHLVNTLLVYLLCRQLSIGRQARAIATTFFYLSPCVAATVWACDSLNQTYSQLWGLLAVLLYLRTKGWRRYLSWLILVFLAVLSKENGLAWAVVPPIVEWGMKGGCQREQLRPLFREFMFGAFIAIAYATIRLSLPHTGDYNPDYQTFDIVRKAKEIGMLLVNTTMAVDLISILHAPSRNLLLGALTVLLSLPFLWMVFLRRPGLYFTEKGLSLAVSALIVVSPNILLSLSMMNAYASLGMAAVLTGYLIDCQERKRPITIAFLLYLVSALIVEVHAWYCSWQSGLLGRELSQKVIRMTGEPVDRVTFIIVEDDYPKFSSFCVVPSDAMGWGFEVQHENHYQWPSEVVQVRVGREATENEIDSLTQVAFGEGFDCVWTIRHKDITVKKK